MPPEPDYRLYFERLVQANQDYAGYYSAHILFSWRWWLLVLLTVVPWFLWWGFTRRRQQLLPLLLPIALCLLMNSTLDNLGVALGLWDYPVKVFPVLVIYLPWSWTILPVFMLGLLQFSPHRRMLAKALIYGGGCAFVGEPIATGLGLYSLKTWAYPFSFGIYFGMFLLIFLLYRKLANAMR